MVGKVLVPEIVRKRRNEGREDNGGPTRGRGGACALLTIRDGLYNGRRSRREIKFEIQEYWINQEGRKAGRGQGRGGEPAGAEEILHDLEAEELHPLVLGREDLHHGDLPRVRGLPDLVEVAQGGLADGPEREGQSWPSRGQTGKISIQTRQIIKIKKNSRRIRGRGGEGARGGRVELGTRVRLDGPIKVVHGNKRWDKSYLKQRKELRGSRVTSRKE